MDHILPTTLMPGALPAALRALHILHSPAASFILCLRLLCAPLITVPACADQKTQQQYSASSSSSDDGPGTPAEMLEDMVESYGLGGTSHQEEAMLSIVVVGGSGDLAKKKIFPALFALYHQGLLPKHVQIVGYARSKSSNEDFREKIMGTLTCRLDKGCAMLWPVAAHGVGCSSAVLSAA